MQGRAGINLGVATVGVLVMALNVVMWIMTGTPSWYDQLSLTLSFVLAGAGSILAIYSLPGATSGPESATEKWARICLGAALFFAMVRGPLVLLLR